MAAELLKAFGLPTVDRRGPPYYQHGAKPPRRFETIDDAIKRTLKRVDVLDRVSGKSGLLQSQLLADVTWLREYRNPLSPLQARSFRLWFLRQNICLWRRSPGDAFIVTLILDFVVSGKLKDFSLARLKRRLRTILTRYGLQGALASGGLEASWDRNLKRWVLHAHLLVLGASEAQVEHLRIFFKRQGKRRMKAQPVRRPKRQLSYLLKFNTFHRPGTQFGSHRASAIPLPDRLQVELMRWWAMHDFADFTFLFGLRRIGGCLVASAAKKPTPPTVPTGNRAEAKMK